MPTKEGEGIPHKTQEAAPFNSDAFIEESAKAFESIPFPNVPEESRVEVHRAISEGVRKWRERLRALPLKKRQAVYRRVGLLPHPQYPEWTKPYQALAERSPVLPFLYLHPSFTVFDRLWQDDVLAKSFMEYIPNRLLGMPTTESGENVSGGGTAISVSRAVCSSS